MRIALITFFTLFSFSAFAEKINKGSAYARSGNQAYACGQAFNKMKQIAFNNCKFSGGLAQGPIQRN